MVSLVIRGIRALTISEKKIALIALFALIASLFGYHMIAYYQNTVPGPVAGGIYTEGMVGQPIAINPVIASQSNSIDQNLIHLTFAPLEILAESIIPREDRAEWTVVLKNGAAWSDGKPIGAEDVRFTIKTIQNAETHSALANAWTGVDIEIISSREFRLTLTEPYVFFEHTMRDFRIIPAHIFSTIPSANLRLSEFNFNPVGSGPYRFAQYEKRPDGFISRYILERNPYYAGNSPFIETIEIVFFLKYEDLISAFNSRKITGFSTSDISLMSKIKSSHTAHAFFLPLYYAVFINTNASVALKERAVRNALYEATNREQLIQTVFQGNARAIYRPLIPGVEGYHDAQHTDGATERAIELLERAGWKIGEDGIRTKTINRVVTRLSLELSYPESPILEATAAILELQWRELGIELIRSSSSPDQIDADLRTRSYSMLLFGNILTGSDPYSFWHSSQRFFPGLNLALYQNSTVDALLESARKNPDSVSRGEMLRKAEELILNDIPAIFLFNPSHIFISVPKLMGIPDQNTIQTPAHRFDDVSSWYLRSGRVFNQSK